MSPSELTDFIAAADIYVTPYRKPEQITSGSLAYAVGSGKAAISTPYRYARERGAEYGRNMAWPAVARRYLFSFERACTEHRARVRAANQAQTWVRRTAEQPNARHAAE